MLQATRWIAASHPFGEMLCVPLRSFESKMGRHCRCRLRRSCPKSINSTASIRGLRDWRNSMRPYRDDCGSVRSTATPLAVLVPANGLKPIRAQRALC
jgi:hypothetical protein